MQVLLLILTLLHFFYVGGFSFTLPNGFPTGPNGFPNNLLNVLPNGFPKGIFNGMPNGVMSVPTGLRSSLPALNIVDGNSTKGQQNITCCFGGTCFSPCPVASGGMQFPLPPPMPVPLPPPAPVLIPARTYYEPVVHNHPPLHKIRHIIRQDRDRRRKRHRSNTYDSSSDCSGTDTDTDSDSFIQDSAIDYHEDVIHVNM